MARKTQLDEFKELVVKIALESAEEYDWCDEIQAILKDKLGLGDLLPPLYVFESLQHGGKRARWHQQWESYDVEEIIKDLGYRVDFYRSQYELKQRQDTFWNSRKVQSFNVSIEPSSDLDTLVTRLKDTFDAAQKGWSKTKTKPEPAQSEWPHLRIRNEKTGEIVKYVNARGEDVRE